MPSLTIKNIPEELLEKLRAQAQSNHRSLNREVIACLDQALRSEARSPQAVLLRARQLRERTQAYLLTAEAFDKARRSGRP